MRLLAVVTALLAVFVGTTTPAARTVTASGAVDPSAIPLGGEPYVGTSPRVGYIDSCQTSFTGGGAYVAGPWIDTANRTWDEATKIAVSGAVSWSGKASYSVKTSGSSRVIAFNDLPTNHTTGTFPIASTDPAYGYDRNPNHIAAQSSTWKLPLDPKAGAKPTCLGMGAIGVLSDGVYLYNGLDAGGRDAAAYEVLDACGGHPDQSSRYHHHDIPPCLLNRAPDGAATLVGYALDGYGIYVVKDAKGNLPANTALDACHGTTSTVPWNGKLTSIYHYVATLEYPYTLGCYHGTPISVAKAGPGGGSGGGGGGGGGGNPPPPPGGAAAAEARALTRAVSRSSGS
ncbi:MAG TPA: YHYH protein [Gaiellaceae bacterium]|nr:YHYH protein [Gaiellaceae bacterium]